MKSPTRSLSRHKRRRGAVLVLVAFCLTVILACVAIAVDGGLLMEERRHAQATADMAALAAAEDLFRNYSINQGYDSGSSAVKRAKAIAAANGYTNDGTNSTVDVRVAPQTYAGGPDKGKAVAPGYAEVNVQFNQPRYFSAIIGSDTIPVTARAVARGLWAPSNIGIHILDLTTKASLTAVGSGKLTVDGGSAVIVNSKDPEAAVSISGTLSASEFDITGGSSGSGFSGSLVYGTPPQPDPLRYLPPPDPSTLIVQSNHTLALNSPTPKILEPGIYKGGINIAGNGNVTLSPGIYYMDGGGFMFTGGGNLVGDGVMIYSDPRTPADQISISGSGGGTCSLTPPTSGPYTGISIFQDRTSTNPISITGNGTFDVKGTFYAANGTTLVGGNGDASIGSQYISRYLSIVGNGDFHVTYNPGQAAPTRILGLVE